MTFSNSLGLERWLVLKGLTSSPDLGFWRENGGAQLIKPYGELPWSALTRILGTEHMLVRVRERCPEGSG